MDPFYAFLIFVSLVALDFLATNTWLAAYFRFGIPVYYHREALTGPLESRVVAQALQERFKSSPLHPSIRFKALNERQVALREAMFENRAGVRYLPVMHSLVRLQPRDGFLTLTGYLNWYVLATLAYLIYRSLAERSFIPVALLILFVLGLSYASQASVAGQVSRALPELDPAPPGE
jgi:hypothetical protein